MSQERFIVRPSQQEASSLFSNTQTFYPYVSGSADNLGTFPLPFVPDERDSACVTYRLFIKVGKVTVVLLYILMLAKPGTTGKIPYPARS